MLLLRLRWLKTGTTTASCRSIPAQCARYYEEIGIEIPEDLRG